MEWATRAAPISHWSLRSREIPVAKAVDVVVSGGGMAGLAAAVSSARHGARTLLIEREGFLGGAATAAMMGLMGSAAALAHGMSKEVSDRLIAAGVAVGGAFTQFDPEGFKQVALEMVQESGVELFWHTTVVDAIVQEHRVRGVVIHTKTGLQAVFGGVVIDASGDADIAVSAGAPFVHGRERDGKMRPISLLFRLGGINCRQLVEFVLSHPEQFSPDPNRNVIDLNAGLIRIEGFYGIMDDLRRRGEVDENIHYLRFEHCLLDKGMVLVNNTRVYDVDGTRPDHLTDAQLKARRQMIDLIAAIRKHIPGCEGAFLIDSAPSLGVRETRRVRGAYVLTEEDIANHAAFADAITEEHQRGAPGHEAHSPDAGEGSRRDVRYREIVWQLYTYEIPYRSLLPGTPEGLLVAGRCISANHQADGWTRLEPVCLLTGQAGGTAAALAMARGVSPHTLDVQELQRTLIADGVRLPARIVAALHGSGPGAEGGSERGGQ